MKTMLFRSLRTVLVTLLCMATCASALAATTTQKKKNPSSSGKAKATATSSTPRARIPQLAANPYLGAIVIDVSTQKVLFEDKADVACYPASVVKLMDILIIIEKVEQGTLSLSDQVAVTRESSGIGGSQVYLKEGESFTLDEMLYALMIKSANDAAVALAIHVAGSKEGFIALMNQRAKDLGMTSSKFSSCHGLPPGKGQEPDMTTPRDMATLCLELLKHPQILQYTSTNVRMFGQGVRPVATQIQMHNHNHLLESFQGCDGLKTGWIRASGYSMAATAMRNNRRVIAVVMGSLGKDTRNTTAKQLMANAFLNLPPAPPSKPIAPVPAVKPASKPDTEKKHAEEDEDGDTEAVRTNTGHSAWFIVGIIGGVLVISSTLAFFLARRLGHL